MLNLSTDICNLFKEARKAKGLNQSALARAVGCQQSAVSMFEGGMSTKLSDEAVNKMAEVLGLDLAALLKQEEQKKEEAASTGVPSSVVAPSVAVPFVVQGYCPNCHCPSNVPYVVEGRLFFRPSRGIASPHGGVRCTQCGELLEMRCPVCGAPLNDGACCAVCGSAYVTPVLPEGVDPVTYARLRREEIIQLRSLT